MNADLGKWCRLTKQQNRIYHQYAKRAGIPDAQFWVLYAVCESDDPVCQNAVCENWCYSRQTTSTAVAGLEKAGLIRQVFAEGSRKQKNLCLTDRGNAFCDQYIRSVMEAESGALNRFSQDQRDRFFDFLEQLLDGVDQDLNG